MRVTSKGQVTTPAEIREKAGFLSEMEVEFVMRGSTVILRKADKPRFLRGAFSVSQANERA